MITPAATSRTVPGTSALRRWERLTRPLRLLKKLFPFAPAGRRSRKNWERPCLNLPYPALPGARAAAWWTGEKYRAMIREVPPVPGGVGRRDLIRQLTARMERLRKGWIRGRQARLRDQIRAVGEVIEKQKINFRRFEEPGCGRPWPKPLTRPV